MEVDDWGPNDARIRLNEVVVMKDISHAWFFVFLNAWRIITVSHEKDATATGGLGKQMKAN